MAKKQEWDFEWTGKGLGAKLNALQEQLLNIYGPFEHLEAMWDEMSQHYIVERNAKRFENAKSIEMQMREIDKQRKEAARTSREEANDIFHELGEIMHHMKKRGTFHLDLQFTEENIQGAYDLADELRKSAQTAMRAFDNINEETKTLKVASGRAGGIKGKLQMLALSGLLILGGAVPELGGDGGHSPDDGGVGTTITVQVDDVDAMKKEEDDEVNMEPDYDTNVTGFRRNIQPKEKRAWMDARYNNRLAQLQNLIPGVKPIFETHEENLYMINNMDFGLLVDMFRNVVTHDQLQQLGFTAPSASIYHTVDASLPELGS